MLDAYIHGFAFQEKTVAFKTAEEAAVLARDEVRKFADLAEERQVAALADECPYPPKLWAAGGDEPVFLVAQDVGRPVSVLDDRLHRGARGAAAGGVDRH